MRRKGGISTQVLGEVLLAEHSENEQNSITTSFIENPVLRKDVWGEFIPLD